MSWCGLQIPLESFDVTRRAAIGQDGDLAQEEQSSVPLQFPLDGNKQLCTLPPQNDCLI